MSVEFGGKTVFGASVGILMLETQFPRIYGDIANANTWPFAVQYRIVRGATPEKVVRNDPRLLVDDFTASARDLVAPSYDRLRRSDDEFRIFGTYSGSDISGGPGSGCNVIPDANPHGATAFTQG